jgi:hypothetical protein
MVRAFDQAVLTRAVAVYGREHVISAPFERLPTDVWPLLTVVDWDNGVAAASRDTCRKARKIVLSEFPVLGSIPDK